ncbi:MAG: ATP-dependent Zn protease [Candidatus Phytoplasma cynodontis]|nr:MAG: ATP-dependent Zn protease [Candidatus Phytoplasma cynodontis]
MKSITKNNLKEYTNLLSFKDFLLKQKKFFEEKIVSLSSDQNNIKITLNDIDGLEKEKEIIRDLMFFLKIKDNENNLPINFNYVKPRGFLLYGPSGIGKTFLIKALSNECNDQNNYVHFFYVDPAMFQSQYVEASEVMINNFCKKIEQYKKSIVFIDEIDVFSNKDNKNKTSIYGITDILMNKIDGFKDNEQKIIVIGATNNLNKIDKSLRIRFDKEIYIGFLKNKEIEEFLKHIVLPLDISYEAFIYLKELATEFYDKEYSNRKIKSVIDSAYIKTAKNKRKSMSASDLKEAFEEMNRRI